VRTSSAPAALTVSTARHKVPRGTRMSAVWCCVVLCGAVRCSMKVGRTACVRHVIDDDGDATNHTAHQTHRGHLVGLLEGLVGSVGLVELVELVKLAGLAGLVGLVGLVGLAG
jgi:hypothetical protein